MGTLYTCVSQTGKKDIIILNPKYSREELAEKLKTAQYSEDWLDTIIKEGRNLQKKLRIKCHADGVITTQKYGSMYYFYKGDKVILHPDGVFCIKPGIFTRFFR